MIVRLWSAGLDRYGARPKDARNELWYVCSDCDEMDGPLDESQADFHQHKCLNQRVVTARTVPPEGSRQINAWTKEEDDIVATYEPMSALDFLPQRTINAIRFRRNKVRRERGISKPGVQTKPSAVADRYDAWTKEEDLIVARHTPVVADRLLPDRTLCAIHAHRAVLKKRGVVLNNGRGALDTEARAYRRAGAAVGRLRGRVGRCVDRGARFLPGVPGGRARAILNHWRESCPERWGLIVIDTEA